MKHDSLLGICIPAYKRPELLRRCILSIIRSAGAHEIPIFVSDDSADETNRDVLAELAKQYPRLTVRANKTNVGIDANILAAASFCDAKFAWLMGEDDALLPDAIPIVLEKLQKNPDLTFLCVNYGYVSNDYRYFLKKRVIPVVDDAVIPGNEFFEKYSWAIGFIGACIVRRDRWRPRHDYVGTYFAHVASIYDQIRHDKVHLVAAPIVLNRAEDRKSFTWSSSTLAVVLSWEALLQRIAKETNGFCARTAVRNSERLFRPRSPLWLISMRAEGVYDLSEYDAHLRARLNTWWERFACKGVALTPQIICRWLKSARKMLLRVQRSEIPQPLQPPGVSER